MTTSVEQDLERVFRDEHGRVVATLVRRFGDIDLAEEAAQEAYLEALRSWPQTGRPPNPGGWLTTTARRRALDRLRRESSRDSRHRQAALVTPDGTGRWVDPAEAAADGEDASGVTDDRLRLIFTCCHPALAREAQVALTLRLLGGLTTGEIARAFLVEEPAMAKRLTRSKQKIAAAHIPYRVPPDHELPARLSGVLATVYLIFNEGYLPAGDERPDLAAEAVRLGRVLVGLMPDEPEAVGLLALMVLTEARRPARFAGGELVPLPEQDRGRWKADLVAEGHQLVRACLRRNRPGPYQLQAAIAAVHTDAARASDTDWRQIVALYDQLAAIAPTPVVLLNRAVAVAEADGADAGMAALATVTGLDGYHAFHATRAELLRMVGRDEEAVLAYQRAVELAENPAELAYLGRRSRELEDAAVGPGVWES